MKRTFCNRLLGALVFFGVIIGSSVQSHAVLKYASFGGNDSQGDNFQNALAFLGLTQSPLIIKVDYLDTVVSGQQVEASTTLGSSFSTIDGSELVRSSDGGQPGTVTFTYTQGASDPNALYAVTKSDGGFNIHYFDDGSSFVSGTQYQVSTWLNQCSYTGTDPDLACSKIKNPTARLSHFAIYDTAPVPPSQPIPEPGTLATLGFGLVGLSWFMRRRRQTA